MAAKKKGKEAAAGAGEEADPMSQYKDTFLDDKELLFQNLPWPGIETLSEDMARQARIIFEQFDTAHTGEVTQADVGAAMRAMALAPSQAELSFMLERKIQEGRADLTAFLEMVAFLWGRRASVDALVRAMQAFDPRGTGFVSAATLRHALASLGEHPLTPDICDGLMAAADPTDSGRVEYRSFAAKMLKAAEEAREKRRLEAEESKDDKKKKR